MIQISFTKIWPLIDRPCGAGGDDWDAAIVDWLITKYLQPAVHPNLSCRVPYILFIDDCYNNA